jgi:amino acid transporter
MARKIPGLQRIIGAETIFAIVYGEVSSSLYFALGVVSLWALGLTPLVLLGAGLLFGLAAAAYQEGVRTVDQPGGSAAVARHAFGDLAGFVVGWAVVLDFAVVIALSLLFVPHYALAMVGDLGVTYPQLADPEGATRAPLGLQGLPYTFFLSRDGSVAYVNPGPLTSITQVQGLIDAHLGVPAPKAGT